MDIIISNGILHVFEFLKKIMVIEIMKFKQCFTQMSLHFKKEKNISAYVNEKMLTMNF
jgi:hypothetical protein